METNIGMSGVKPIHQGVTSFKSATQDLRKRTNAPVPDRIDRMNSLMGDPFTLRPAESLDRLSEVEAAAVARKRPAGDTKAAAISGLRFHVVGTDLSLNERVTFAGEMVTGTNTFGVGYAAGGQAGLPTVSTRAPTSAAAPMAGPRQLVPLPRIQGQATVGEGTKLEINAAPVGR